LVAGCGAATRVDFKGHSRPASPLEVSVYLGGGRPVVDPRTITPGPVQFNVTNQTAKPQTLAIAVPGGRRVTRSLTIPAGGTGQVQTTLRPAAYGVEQDGPPAAITLISTRGRGRTGDNQLLQP
jgi:hypothetical protein